MIIVSKQILSSQQLKKKLLDYNFNFNDDDFFRLEKLGFFHVVNSLVPSTERKNSRVKNLVDYLIIYDLDKELRGHLFPMIVELEGVFKQRLKDVLVDTIKFNGSINSSHNEVIKFCIQDKHIISAKKTFYGCTNKKSRIIEHYFKNFNEIPIWAYMELLSLNEFINFIGYTHDTIQNNRTNVQEKFVKKCGYEDSQGVLIKFKIGADAIIQTLRLLKEVRNNIAHNQQIIDNRALDNIELNYPGISSTVKIIGEKCNSSVTYVGDFEYKKITDFIVLVYINYIYIIGNDKLSSNLLGFIDHNIINNISGLNQIIVSKIFGNNYLQKFTYIKDL